MELFAALLVVVILAIPVGFWIVMFVHAIRRKIPDKGLWIIALLLGGLISAAIYYNVVYISHKR